MLMSPQRCLNLGSNQCNHMYGLAICIYLNNMQDLWILLPLSFYCDITGALKCHPGYFTISDQYSKGRRVSFIKNNLHSDRDIMRLYMSHPRSRTVSPGLVWTTTRAGEGNAKSSELRILCKKLLCLLALLSPCRRGTNSKQAAACPCSQEGANCSSSAPPSC